MPSAERRRRGRTLSTMLAHVADDGDDQRGAGVLQPAQHAGGGEHEQQRGDAEDGDAQVGRGLVRDRGAGAEERRRAGRSSSSPTRVERRRRARRRARGRRRPGRARRARSPAPRRRATPRGGAVGEEDAEPDGGLQHDGGDPRPASSGVPRWPDDGGVGEQEERLGDQRQEGRHGQPEDLAVLVPRPHRARDWPVSVTTHGESRSSARTCAQPRSITVDSRRPARFVDKPARTRRGRHAVNRNRARKFSLHTPWSDVSAGQSRFGADADWVCPQARPQAVHSACGVSSTGSRRVIPRRLWTSRLSRGRRRARTGHARLVRVPRPGRDLRCRCPPLASCPSRRQPWPATSTTRESCREPHRVRPPATSRRPSSYRGRSTTGATVRRPTSRATRRAPPATARRRRTWPPSSPCSARC